MEISTLFLLSQGPGHVIRDGWVNDYSFFFFVRLVLVRRNVVGMWCGETWLWLHILRQWYSLNLVGGFLHGFNWILLGIPSFNLHTTQLLSPSPHFLHWTRVGKVFVWVKFRELEDFFRNDQQLNTWESEGTNHNCCQEFLLPHGLTSVLMVGLFSSSETIPTIPRFDLKLIDFQCIKF